jgi:phenylacetate-CoA ligase
MTHPQARFRSLVNETQISTLAATRHRARGLVEYLERSRPKGIVAFPSALRMLSEGLNSNHDSFRSSLKAVVSTGEMLLPLERTRLSSAFGVEVYDRYSTQEVPGEWAQQCASRNQLHWNPAIVFLEIRHKERAARAGETGRVLLTDLWNRAMPLVRYEVGDEAALGTNCNCGRTWGTIAGPIRRSQDYFTLKKGEHMQLAEFAAIVMEEFGQELVHFQFLETGESTYKVRIIPTLGIDFDRSALREYLLNYFRDALVERDDPIRLSSGKSPILLRSYAGVSQFHAS